MGSIERFWTIARRVSAATDGTFISYEDAEALYRSLGSEEVVCFLDGLDQRLGESFRWDIWAVGAILQGHIGVEFFTDYQIWLVLQGEAAFTGILDCPDAAAELASEHEPSTRFGFLYLKNAAGQFYRDATGREYKSLARRARCGEPRGKRWNWQDLAGMHPDLWRRFFQERERRPNRPTEPIMDDDRLVWEANSPLAAWVDIYAEPAYCLSQYDRLSPMQRALHAVSWMRAEVGNGGFDQFFHNPSGIVARQALRGLELFGATETHRTLAAIMAAFPGGAPSLDCGERQRQMFERWRRHEQVIDDEFRGPIGHGDFVALEARIAAFIRSHPEAYFRA